MGIFNIFKKKKSEGNTDSYYKAQPSFYKTPEGGEIGVFTLTEDTETLMAVDPKTFYAEHISDSTNFVLMLFSLTKDTVIGELDFYQAREKLRPYIKSENETAMLIKGLTLEEMENLLK